MDEFERACDRLMDVLADNRIGDADISATLAEPPVCQVNLYSVDEINQLAKIIKQRGLIRELQAEVARLNRLVDGALHFP